MSSANSTSPDTSNIDLASLRNDGEKRLEAILSSVEESENESVADLDSITKYLDEYQNIDKTLDALDACVGYLDKQADDLSRNINKFLSDQESDSTNSGSSESNQNNNEPSNGFIKQMKAKFCGPKCSICCTLLSTWGIIMLGILGVLFWIRAVGLFEDLGVELKLKNNTDPNAPPEYDYDEVITAYQTVAINCWIASGIYVLFLGISFWQWKLNVAASQYEATTQ